MPCQQKVASFSHSATKLWSSACMEILYCLARSCIRMVVLNETWQKIPKKVRQAAKNELLQFSKVSVFIIMQTRNEGGLTHNVWTAYRTWSKLVWSASKRESDVLIAIVLRKIHQPSKAQAHKTSVYAPFHLLPLAAAMPSIAWLACHAFNDWECRAIRNSSRNFFRLCSDTDFTSISGGLQCSICSSTKGQ